MKSTFLTLSVLFVFITSYAESTSGKKVLMYPKAYTSPTGLVEPSDCDRLSSTSMTNVWVVFSDRAKNPTYTTDKGGTVFKQMNYMDAFYVIEDKLDYVHIVKYDVDAKLISSKDYKLTRDLEDYGWAPKANLVLWTRCLVDEKTKFTIKALSINSVQNLNEIAAYAKGKNLKLFNDPDLREENTAECRLFDFLYIYKRTDKSVLIATTESINRVQSKRAYVKILGWVSVNVIKEWRDRITLEPNWDQEAVDERKKAGIKASIFSNEPASASYKDKGISDNKSVLWSNDPLATSRKVPEWKRLPMIKQPDAQTGIIQTGAVTEVFNKEGKAVINEDEQSGIEKEYNQLRENYRKVNIVFVIDGSEVMTDYFEPIVSTISECANKLNTLDDEQKESGATGNSYKLGAVVYRSYADKDCNGKITDFQEKSLTTNYGDVAYWLNQEVKFGSCSKLSPYKALFAGIQKGIKQFQDTKGQTNIIIVIGAGGNVENDARGVSEAALVAQLAANRVGMLAFQAKHPSDPAYDEFYSQILNLIEKSSQKVQQEIAITFPDRKYKPAYMRDKGNNVFKLSSPKESPIPGGLMISDMNNPLKPSELNDQVIKLLTESEDAKEEILAGVDNKLKGQGVRTDVNEGMYAFLSQMKVNVELLRKSSADNIQLFVDGYTAINCEKLKNPLYKRCLFLSFNELSELIKDLSSINATSTSKSGSRETIYNAFKSLLSARIGPKEAKKKMGSLTGSDLMQLITNVAPKNPLFSKFKLSEIMKEKVVSESDLEQIRQDISNKLEDLEKYKEESNSFGSNDIDYYWVPEDYLP